MADLIEKNNNVIGREAPLLLISGSCVIENYETAFEIASFLKEVTLNLDIPFVFKASYDKANRTSIGSFRGPGINEGLEILGSIKKELDITLFDTEIPWPFFSAKFQYS